ncbi:hypothetical protein PU634_10260 [Oceanimonas pelagia]|uniref:Uncharacterized protein n=1 Tax=Oceanimonas pelagia TaxID=3028314 RepID=A0AA50KLX1_9GAMM|nr:hypothetical protein [Oceanimonas pelagia]WMC09498.1 hypothetical protein PU634_10260 [Oceanimonas pelagia]
MIQQYVVYDTNTGEISHCFSGIPEFLPLNVMEGQSALPCPDGVTDAEYWVEHATGTIHSKGDYPLEQLPLPCTVTIEGVNYHCTEQPVFEFDAPGTYIIKVNAGPQFLKKEFEFDYQP